jgi:phage tail-like protein
MTQGIDRRNATPTPKRTLSLQLLPIQVLDPPPVGMSNVANLVTWGALPYDIDQPHEPYLCLCPGESGEMLVRLAYSGSESLGYQLQIQGDLPNSLQFDIRTEGQRIDSLHPVAEAVIRFRPNADFFEERQAVQEESVISQEFMASVRLYQQDEAGQVGPLIATEFFRIFVRPRSLYSAFLPAVYREVDFIGRLLKIFEQSFEPAFQTLQSFWAYLDPLTAPQALLPFLAQWVGWQNEAHWTLPQQRQLIRRAMEIYRWRGTKRGLKLYLHLYTNLPLQDPTRPRHAQPIQIHEVFHRGFILGETAMGNSSLLGGGKPFHFIVRLRPDRSQSIDQNLVRLIIEQEKPAFCTYDLYVDTYDESTRLAARGEV